MQSQLGVSIKRTAAWLFPSLENETKQEITNSGKCKKIQKVFIPKYERIYSKVKSHNGIYKHTFTRQRRNLRANQGPGNKPTSEQTNQKPCLGNTDSKAGGSCDPTTSHDDIIVNQSDNVIITRGPCGQGQDIPFTERQREFPLRCWETK